MVRGGLPGERERGRERERKRERERDVGGNAGEGEIDKRERERAGGSEKGGRKERQRNGVRERQPAPSCNIHDRHSCSELAASTTCMPLPCSQKQNFVVVSRVRGLGFGV